MQEIENYLSGGGSKYATAPQGERIDQGTRPLGGVALVPCRPAQPVAEVDVGDVAVGTGTEVDPAQELRGSGGLYSADEQAWQLGRVLEQVCISQFAQQLLVLALQRG